VPACGCYEWQGEGRDKTPYYIYPEDQQYLAFAGLYDVWITPTAEELYTFTIITTDADESMAKLHNRMPVILTTALEEAWLNPELTQVHDVLDVLSRSPGLVLDAYPVSRLVNTPSHDSELLIQRVESHTVRASPPG
jgi:putative SOS response-associated peptidase YedK